MHKYLVILTISAVLVLCLSTDSSAFIVLEADGFHTTLSPSQTDYAQMTDAVGVVDASLTTARVRLARA